MAHLSTRHDNKQSGILSNELVSSMLSREVPTDIQIHNHNIQHIGNLSDHPGLRKIDISFNPIDDLRGIDQCPQLRQLCVYGGGKLTDLQGLEGVKKLEVLLIQRNALGPTLGLTFHNLTKLRELRVDKNQITHLGTDLASCTSLRRLDLSHNQLSSLEGLGGLQSLEELRVTNNNITTFKHLRALPSLMEIDISYNKLKSLDGLEFIPTLTILRAEHNHINTLKIPKIYGIDKSNPSLGNSGGIASSMGKLTNILNSGNSVTSTSTGTGANKNKSSGMGGKGGGSISKSTGALGNSTNTARGSVGGKNGTLEGKEISQPINPHSTVIGLVLLTDVYVIGNRLSSFTGIETLCPNVKYLDARSNKISALAMLGNADGTCEKGGDDGDMYNVDHQLSCAAATATGVTSSTTGSAVTLSSTTTTTATAASGSASGVAKNSVLMLAELKKLNELLLDMNPVAEDAQAMKTITSILRTTCKNLTAVDGTSFLSQNQTQQSIAMGKVLLRPAKETKENDSEDNRGPFITGTNGSVNGDDNASIAETVGEFSDNEDEDETPEDRKMRKSMELRAARDPNSGLRPKIMPKVVTMEKIQESEESIRRVVTDSRAILKAILMLDDTVDGLFASVNPNELPAENEQMQKILAVSLPPPPSPTKPTDVAPPILSPRTAMKMAVQTARERNARVALALGEEPAEEEPEEMEEDASMLGLGKPGYHKRPMARDAEDQVHIAHNVTVYTTQGDMILDSGKAGEGSGGLAIDAADVKGGMKGGVTGEEDEDLTLAALDPRSPLYVKPKATNKDKVKNLVKSIRDSIEAEFAALSPQEKKDREKSKLVGGTVGTTTRPTHDADLPVGSGLTRYGSKIKATSKSSGKRGPGLDPFASTASLTSGADDEEEGDEYEEEGEENENDALSTTAGVTNSTSNIQHSPITKDEKEDSPHQIANNPNKYNLTHVLAVEAEKKQLDTEKAVWSYSHAGNANPDTTPSRLGLDFSAANLNDGPVMYTSPVINYENHNAEVADTALAAIASDRRKAQELIDRRLGFSLTDPKSPIPGSRSNKTPTSSSPTPIPLVAAVATAVSGSTAAVMGEGYEFSEISPRAGVFDKYQITAGRTTSAGSASGSGADMTDIFAQTFDPRFHKNVGLGVPQSAAPQDQEKTQEHEEYGAEEEEEEGEEGSDQFYNSKLLSGHASISADPSMRPGGIGDNGVTNIGHSPVMNDDDDDEEEEEADAALAFKQARRQQNMMDDYLSDDGEDENTPYDQQMRESVPQLQHSRKPNHAKHDSNVQVVKPTNIVVSTKSKNMSQQQQQYTSETSDQDFVQREMEFSEKQRAERNVTSASNAAIRAALQASTSSSSLPRTNVQLHSNLQRPTGVGGAGAGAGMGMGVGANKALIRPGQQQLPLQGMASAQSMPKFRTPNMRSNPALQVKSTSESGAPTDSALAVSEVDMASLDLEAKVLRASNSTSSINVLQLSPRGR